MKSLTDTFETLKITQVEDHLVTVLLNRPESANATNTQMGRDLLDLWTGLYVDQQGIRCVVLGGAGDKFFSAGGDLKERNGMTDEQWQRQHALFELARTALLNCPVPVIAAVNGIAFGGGLETVLACDFAYADRRARFALTEVKLGIMPGGMGTQLLPRYVGRARAKEVILTAKPFSAEDALAWGLINKLCDEGQVMQDALETARAICANAPLAIYRARKAVDIACEVDIASGSAFELEAYNRLVGTEDRIEGVRAFNEHRPARFRGK